MTTAIYPGSFDPVTNGHLDLIRRASGIFDRLIVAVAINHSKKPLFTIEERMEFIKRAVSCFSNVEVDHFEGLLVAYAADKGAQVIVKGLRDATDFGYELQMDLINRKLQPKIDTMYLMSGSEYSCLSSSIVKEVASLGGSIEGLVPDVILHDILKKFDR